MADETERLARLLCEENELDPDGPGQPPARTWADHYRQSAEIALRRGASWPFLSDAEQRALARLRETRHGEGDR